MKERIDVLLVKMGFFATRQKAKYAIENNCVEVNNEIITKVSKLVEEDSNIKVKNISLPYVSRGGLKLEKAINYMKINLKGKTCIDIGASTGGFTDCMLQNGALKVYSIDVGHNQLDEKLKNDERVINLEGTNIKNIDVKKFEKVDFISIDVSFISLTQVLEKASLLLKENGEMVILIKPQFEAGKDAINKNGVVKDKIAHRKVIEKIILYLNSLSLNIKDLTFSPIKGPAGNIEYLAYIKNEKQDFDLFLLRERIKKIVDEAHAELK